MNQLKEKAEKLGNITILTGGISAERKVSLASGKGVYNALKQLTNQLELIDINQNNIQHLGQQLLASETDVVFIALHGPGGEDGSMQGYLNWLNIPYTGSGTTASALAMDKYRTKLIWQASGLPTPPCKLLTKAEDVAAINLPLPVAIKPVDEGSSFGVSKVMQKEQLLPAWHKAGQYGNSVLAESWVEGQEFTIAFLDDQILPIIKLQPREGFYDHAAKYQRQDTQYIFEHSLSAEAIEQAHQITTAARQAIGVRHFGRIDLIQDNQGQFQLLEINSLPGMTSSSLLPKAAQQAGISFAELIIRMLESAGS